jgi:tRNA G10  N-methylase Trm11
MSESSESSHLFISGKNWKLSLAELISFLEARGFEFKILERSETFFVFEIKPSLPESAINDLGGILKVAKITGRVTTQILRKAFFRKNKAAKENLKRDLPLAKIAENIAYSYSEKPFFGISVYQTENLPNFPSNEIQRFIGSSIKKELKTLGYTSDFMGFSRQRNLPQLTPVEVLKKDLVKHEAEILFCVGRDQAMLGITVGVHNPFEFQKRDTGKPMQRKIFAMPPRLAKIMVNLSHCIPGKTFLDPFCGVGTILQEALLIQATVVGIDANSWCIAAATKNLEWLVKEYALKNAKYKLQEGDARNIENTLKGQVDCIATEPDLGPALRQIPTFPYATKIADRLRPLYREFVKSAYASLKDGGRLALVTPLIRTRTGQFVALNIQQAAESAGFRIVNPFDAEFFDQKYPISRSDAPLIDMYERQNIGREIHIFQK